MPLAPKGATFAKPMISGQKPKILIVRFSSIGDIVLTSPVLRCLRQHIPDCEIHYLTKNQYADLIIHNPHIDKCFIIKNDIHEIIDTLKKEKYTLIIDLHRNLRTFRLKLHLRVPSVTFNKLNIRKWLTVRLKKNLLPEIHIVDRMMHSIRHLGVEYDGKGLELFVSKNIQLPENISDFIKSNKEYYVFAIGGTYYTKRFPPEKVIELCHNIKLPVILVGGTVDRDNGNLIAEALGAQCRNVCGQTDLLQSSQIIENARFVISNDTGMMHIAAAMKKPIISLWGNTIPAFGMTPLLPDDFWPQPLIAEVKNLKCRPCSKLGYQKCPKGHFRCMNDIDLKPIILYLTQNQLI